MRRFVVKYQLYEGGPSNYIELPARGPKDAVDQVHSNILVDGRARGRVEAVFSECLIVQE